MWDGLLIIAIMFTGTAIYRADHWLTSWWWAAVVATMVAGALLTAWFAELDAVAQQPGRYRLRAVITVVVICALFAVGMATRRTAVSRSLAWLGLVSYSVYLTHFTLLQVFRPVFDAAGRWPEIAKIFVAGVFLALLAGCCWATHRFIELPGQRLGRRWTRWMNARWGSDAQPARGSLRGRPSHGRPCCLGGRGIGSLTFQRRFVSLLVQARGSREDDGAFGNGRTATTSARSRA